MTMITMFLYIRPPVVFWTPSLQCPSLVWYFPGLASKNYYIRVFFYACVMVADVFGQDEEKHYWQICKCCSSTRDKKLFEQKGLMASHRITCWLHQQTKYSTTRGWTNICLSQDYHFQAEVSANLERVQADSSREEQQGRSRNSSRRWSFGSCSLVTPPGWRFHFMFELLKELASVNISIVVMAGDEVDRLFSGSGYACLWVIGDSAQKVNGGVENIAQICEIILACLSWYLLVLSTSHKYPGNLHGALCTNIAKAKDLQTKAWRWSEVWMIGIHGVVQNMSTAAQGEQFLQHEHRTAQNPS